MTFNFNLQSTRERCGLARICRCLWRSILWVTQYRSCYFCLSARVTWNLALASHQIWAKGFAAITVPVGLKFTGLAVFLSELWQTGLLFFFYPQRGFESDPLTWVLTKYPHRQRQFKEDLAAVVDVITQLIWISQRTQQRSMFWNYWVNDW